MDLINKLKYILDCNDELIIKYGKYEIVDTKLKKNRITLNNHTTISMKELKEEKIKIFKRKELEPVGNVLKMAKMLQEAIDTIETENPKFIIEEDVEEVGTKQGLIDIMETEDYADLNYVIFFKLTEKKNYLSKDKNFDEDI